jgi:hypothetical protein
MTIADFTLAAFTLCNSFRVLAYVPQIVRAATDRSGAQAVSCATWGLFLVSHASAAAYALVNKADWTMASVFIGNAIGCGTILLIAACKRSRHRRQTIQSATGWSLLDWQMNSRREAADTGLEKPDNLPPSTRRPALRVRILTRLLTALHDSRAREAAGVVWRHQDFRINFQSTEHPVPANVPPCTTTSSSARAGIRA